MIIHSPFVRFAAVAVMLSAACTRASEEARRRASDLAQVKTEVEAAVWAFHAADTARDAEAVIRLLWPEYTMLADGSRLSYEQVAAGSREFMAGLALFHTDWYDLQVTPLGQDAAVASFQFRDSIVTNAGELIRNRGTTIFVWQRRGGEWRVLFADANHRPAALPADIRPDPDHD
jgi:hypothetical protein